MRSDAFIKSQKILFLLLSLLNIFYSSPHSLEFTVSFEIIHLCCVRLWHSKKRQSDNTEDWHWRKRRRRRTRGGSSLLVFVTSVCQPAVWASLEAGSTALDHRECQRRTDTHSLVYSSTESSSSSVLGIKWLLSAEAGLRRWTRARSFRFRIFHCGEVTKRGVQSSQSHCDDFCADPHRYQLWKQITLLS